MAVLHINTQSFQKAVLDAEGTVRVDYTAAWCGPCQMLSPLVDAFAEKHPEIRVCKLDIDESMDTAIAHGVLNVPTLIVFKNGEAVERLVGLMPKSSIITNIEKHI